jgi:predicted ATPase/class 3 adenylate cyclase
MVATEVPVAHRPTGTVTFLFTDIEGSSVLWEEHPEAMKSALAVHDSVIRGAIEVHRGYVFATGGDAFAAAFDSPPDALLAAIESQRGLAAEQWGSTGPLRVRMALHTGVAEERDGDYFGPPLNRCARLLGAGHGGQVLSTRATADLFGDDLPPGVELIDLGEQRLRDLARPEHIVAVVHPALPTDLPPLRTLGAVPHNLPVQLTSFVGRDQELAEADKLLAGCRLLTLTGVGGAGKTRLSLQLAAAAIEDHPDGAWLVELAPVADPAVVPAVIAEVLGVKEEPSRSTLDSLVAHLRSRQLLLILDNCEHLTDVAADLADQMLRACPELRILATSREMLGVPGEVAFQVRSMATPAPDEIDPAGFRRYDAIRLFEERAAVVRPDFRVTADNAGAVATVCRRLDGIPLAVELAAARVRMLTPDQIAVRLDDRFRLLTGGSRTVLPRQQTLEAAIDWSYELLDKPERLVFDRLSVFAGGFTLEDAEQVCSDDELDAIEVFDIIARLNEKSLVAIDSDAAENRRYRMLETLRQYAAKKLAGSGTGDAVRRRHAEHFTEVAAGCDLQGSGQEESLARLEADHDNLRAALRWCLESGEIETGLRLGFEIWYFWHIKGLWSEGLDWLDRLLAAGPEAAPSLRARALHAAGTLTSGLGQLGGAAVRLEEALAITRELGELDRTGAALNNLASTLQARGDYAGAHALFEEVWELGLAHDHFGQPAVVMQNLGWSATTLGSTDEAEAWHRRALEFSRKHDLPFGEAGARFGLAVVAYVRGELERADEFIGDALSIVRRIGARPFLGGGLIASAGVAQVIGDLERAAAELMEALPIVREIDSSAQAAWWLRNAARVHADAGRHERAALLLGADEAIRGESVVMPWDRTPLEVCIAQTMAALGGDAYRSAKTAGRQLTRAEALATGLEDLAG